MNFDIMNKISLLGMIIILLSILTFAHAVEPTKPNIVVMLVDDLGSGDVSCLFSKQVQTPNIDRLANMGVKFTSGYVTVPLCGPSRAGFFSGRYPQRFQFVNNSGGIPTDLPLFPSVMRESGYRTGLIGKWHSSGPMPHERGCFDESLCSPKSSPFIDFHHPTLSRNGVVEQSDVYSTDLFAHEAETFIEKNKNQPFFLTVTFNAPHILKVIKSAQLIRKEYDASVAAGHPIDVPKVPMARPGDLEKFTAQFPGDVARADTVATIFALDQAVGRILDKLKQTGLDQKTMVFFFGDNGGHPENRSENLPLRDYKWSMYEGGIRVPFIAAYPGVFPAGLTFSQPVSSMDIFATCAAQSGSKVPGNLDGIDLTPHLTGIKKSPPHEALFFSLGGDGAVRMDQWKLVLIKGEPTQLFDLTVDEGEKHNLATSNPELVASLTERWKNWYKEMPAVKDSQSEKK